MSISQSPSLRMIAGGFSGLAICAGLNAIIRPSSGLQLLQFPTPLPSDQKLVDNLVRIYGARSVAMGLTQGIIAYFGTAATLGYVLFANSIIALVDGFVSKDLIGKGEWNHWGFLSISFGLGGALLGLFDR